MYEGELIRYLRKERNISQEGLADGICSIRHLSNIESGKSTVSYDLVLKFFHRLGTDVNLIVNKDIQQYGVELYKKFKELNTLFYQWEYDKLYELLLSFESKYILETYYRKKIMYYKAVCIHELFHDSTLAKALLL
jgi:transcriptional regulator with XRE-family HTH domain